jgi:hypothetical protein
MTADADCEPVLHLGRTRADMAPNVTSYRRRLVGAGRALIDVRDLSARGRHP